GTRSSKSIAFVHHKGGTGKTTSCLNIAGWLVRMKKKVLVVDLDPQGNATCGLGIDRKTLEGSIYDVFFGQHNIEEVIIETDSGIYLAPSSIDLLAAETHMAGQINNTTLLKESLIDIEKHFDYILIDVPPGSTLLMINGIVASENIIIPLDSGVFAYETLDTLKTLLIDLRDELGIEVNVMMMLLKRYAGINTIFGNPTREMKKALKEFLVENNIPSVNLFTIPFSINIYKAQMRGMPISHYAPRSDVGRVYKGIAKEIINTD
ncbi:MAG: AAA family ATPase, partial [Candidatus Omnitrophica bacterium]|nr:AAA family ATPase [Candidatus Omnitrophota bacterium]